VISLGITGRARGGKSTVASAIVKEANKKGLTAEIFELSAYVLKDAISQGLIPTGKSREDLTPKEVEQLVVVGTQRREEHPDYWIRMMKRDVRERKADVAIIPNVRYLNEAQAVRDLGGNIVRVQAYVADNVEWVSRDRDPNHSSEIENYQIQADYFLVTRRGQSYLLGRQAATLFNYLIEGADHAN